MVDPSKPLDKLYLYIWIDILGFGDKLKRGNEDIFDDLFRKREKLAKKFTNEGDIQSEVILLISDSLLIVCDLDRIEPRKLFDNLARLQIEFILEEKEFMRGGMAVGRVSQAKLKELREKNNNRIEEVFLISDGLVKAYELESKNVLWPVVATTDEVLDEIRKVNHIDDVNESFDLERVRGTNHGVIYIVDFLKYLEDEDKRNDFEYLLWENLKKFENNKRVFDKYMWLLEYYQVKFDSKIRTDKCKNYTDGILL